MGTSTGRVRHNSSQEGMMNGNSDAFREMLQDLQKQSMKMNKNGALRGDNEAFMKAMQDAQRQAMNMAGNEAFQDAFKSVFKDAQRQAMAFANSNEFQNAFRDMQNYGQSKSSTGTNSTKNVLNNSSNSNKAPTWAAQFAMNFNMANMQTPMPGMANGSNPLEAFAKAMASATGEATFPGMNAKPRNPPPKLDLKANSTGTSAMDSSTIPSPISMPGSATADYKLPASIPIRRPRIKIPTDTSLLDIGSRPEIDRKSLDSQKESHKKMFDEAMKGLDPLSLSPRAQPVEHFDLLKYAEEIDDEEY